MNSPRRRSPNQFGRLSDTVESLLTAGAVVLMVASIACMVVLVSTAFSSPRVGDVVVFKPGTQVADSLSFTAHRVGPAAKPNATCQLDPAVMVDGGGSLVVESRSVEQSRYTVHWAGLRTAPGLQDCGQSADLTMQKSDLETMVNAMGGRGIAGSGHVF